MRHSGSQADFVRALTGHGDAPTSLRLARHGEASALRFGVYRNNVSSSLAAALAARYPALLALLGDMFFFGAAREFARANPPRSPVMLAYGVGFAEFLAKIPEAQDVPYAADVARLEWAAHEALHAADADPASLSALAALPEERLDGALLTLHPATRLVESRFPVLSIWRAAIADAPDHHHQEFTGAEHVLISRPAFAVQVQSISLQTSLFLAALGRGQTLGAAATEAGSEFNLAASLSQIFAAGAIVGVSSP
jgi:hypothetical protein